jgi:hypothetical protein
MNMRWRKTMGPCTRRGLFFVALLAAGAAWGPGCDDDSVTGSCPDRVLAGTIRGHVDVGPMAFDGRVRVQSIHMTYPYAYTVNALIDSDGSYSVQVPYGSYYARVDLTSAGASYFYADVGYRRSGGQWVVASSGQDTLVLDEKHPLLELDLVSGSLEVLVHAPEELEGRYVGLMPEHTRLPQPSYSYLHWCSASAKVANGAALFQMPGFLPGACRLKVSIERDFYGEEVFYLPGTRNAQEADTFTVEPSQVTHCEIDLTAPAALLSGSVRGSWQILDCPYPIVDLYSLDSTLVAEQVCSWEGCFSFRLYRPEPVKVRVSIDGVGRWIGGDSFADAVVFALQPGSVAEVPELVESGILVRLDLLDYSSDSMLRLVLYDATTLERVRTTPLNTSVGASLVCANLLPGTYRVFIDNAYLRSSAVSQWFDRAPDIQSAAVVTVPGDGQVAEIRAVLEAGGEIRGQVRGPDYICSAVFYVVDVHTGICVGCAGCLPCDCACICDNPLLFRARGVPDGDYKVGVVVERGTFSEDPPPAGTRPRSSPCRTGPR